MAYILAFISQNLWSLAENSDVMIYELRITSYELLVGIFFANSELFFACQEKKSYKLPIFFTSFELLFTSYDLLFRSWK